MQCIDSLSKIWNNCKIYNQHGSAIWYVADYMSKLFERIYHAWVLEFRERYIRWADPRARPWEHSCRIHDGSCRTPDEKMVLCDHCDGMYGMACLDPPLKKVPKQIWHCPDCKPRLKSVKGGRMLSAVAENAARKRAELGDIPKKKVTQTMYLVKWAGLGYEFCSWETRKDVANDKLIADFHRNLLKGGIYIYPPTKKAPNGKLRLLYECNPFAFIVEKAGGLATNGIQNILDIEPTALHQRTPFFIGSIDMMEELKNYMN